MVGRVVLARDGVTYTAYDTDRDGRFDHLIKERVHVLSSSLKRFDVTTLSTPNLGYMKVDATTVEGFFTAKGQRERFVRSSHFDLNHRCFMESTHKGQTQRLDCDGRPLLED
jgi:hypothetical protein